MPRAPDWYRFVLQSASVAVALTAPHTRAELDEDLTVLQQAPLTSAEYAVLGAPTMVAIAERLLAIRRRFGLPVLIVVCGVMFLDNAVWFFGAGVDLAKAGNSDNFFPNPIYIDRNARDVLDRLNDEVFTGGLVVSNARPLSYQVIVYSPLKAWYSQMWNTPYPEARLAELDALFHDGREIGSWRHRKMIAVVERQRDPKATGELLSLGYQLNYQNAVYDILLRLPLS